MHRCACMSCKHVSLRVRAFMTCTCRIDCCVGYLRVHLLFFYSCLVMNFEANAWFSSFDYFVNASLAAWGALVQSLQLCTTSKLQICFSFFILFYFILFYFLVVFLPNNWIIHLLSFFVMNCGIRTNRIWNYRHVSVFSFNFVSCLLTIEEEGWHSFPLKYYFFSFYLFSFILYLFSFISIK